MAPDEKAPLIAFIVTEDWFFASHFLPMARAARGRGYRTLVITRVRGHCAVIEAEGARVVPLEAERRSLNPWRLGDAAGRLAAILKDEKPDLVHCIALRSILIGGFAAMLAGIDRRLYALTGLGFFGARQDAVGRIGRAFLTFAIRNGLESRRTHYLFENKDDPLLLGLDPLDTDRVTIVGGAGIDAGLYTPAPFAARPPLKIAFVSRMLWSKGVDLAVEAVKLARERGNDVTLSLFGIPDPSNPKAISEALLREWGARPGIVWHGATQDVRAVWREHHIACLPSRGGEGLPRTLLEAAACGRAILTSDVPGCRDLVRDGIEGFVVATEDVEGLTTAISRLCADPALALRMGEAARERIFDGFTEKDLQAKLKRLYERILEEE